MTGAIVVRAANPAEIDRLADLVFQLWEAHEDAVSDTAAARDRAADLMQTSDVKFFEQDGAVIGYAALQDLGDYMLVRHFVINTPVRGRGTGRAAYDALATACFPGRAVRLDAAIHVPGPRAFWEALGFVPRAWSMEYKPEIAA